MINVPSSISLLNQLHWNWRMPTRVKENLKDAVYITENNSFFVSTFVSGPIKPAQSPLKSIGVKVLLQL